MGPAARPAVPALERALSVEGLAGRDQRKHTQENLELALERIQAPPQEGDLAELALILQDIRRDGAERQAAAEVLGYVGPGAESAIPALTRALRDHDPRVRMAAATALKKIQP